MSNIQTPLLARGCKTAEIDRNRGDVAAVSGQHRARYGAGDGSLDAAGSSSCQSYVTVILIFSASAAASLFRLVILVKSRFLARILLKRDKKT